MIPTARDLAKAAGVSLATVDRVLNNRPNVSKKAKQQVNDAIVRIGFVRNLAAVNLARNRQFRFKFILPESGDQYLNEILRRVAHANDTLKADSTSVEAVQISMLDPHHVADYLTSLSHDDVDGVAVMAPESPPVRDAIGRLHERSINVVQFLSGQEKLEELDFIGVENYSAGSTAGRLLGRFLGNQPGKIMVIAETMQSLDSIERRLGFDNVINEKFLHLTPLPSLETYGDSKRATKIIATQIQNVPNIKGVYVLSSEARVPVEILSEHLDLDEVTVIAHERTPFTEKALREFKVDAIVAQNAGHAVRSAIRTLRARGDNREPLTEQETIRIEILIPDNL